MKRNIQEERDEIKVLLEGKTGKVMKGKKLLEVVEFEEGDNLLEAMDTLKKVHLLEGLDLMSEIIYQSPVGRGNIAVTISEMPGEYQVGLFRSNDETSIVAFADFTSKDSALEAGLAFVKAVGDTDVVRFKAMMKGYGGSVGTL